ncbi:MAG: ABC transporter permease [Bdellovibrionota bacterium]
MILLQLIESTIRVSTPLLLAAVGGIVCERSGVINIALEGKMLIGAFAAAAVSHLIGSPWIGVGAAIIFGAITAAFYALIVIEFKADQIVAGTAVNMLAVGLTPFVSKIMFDSTGSTPALPLSSRFQVAPVIISWLVVIMVWAWMKYIPTGRWVRFAGEHPEALEASGISVRAVRWWSVIAGGCFAGLAGSTLSIFLASSFSRNMTAGRGFIALAAVIFGKWHPLYAAAACLFFGFAEALQIRLQGVTLWDGVSVPVQFIQIMPYVATVFVLAGFIGRARPPRSLGLPFKKG